MTTPPETWILYKAVSGDAPGWEERQLMPSGSLTDILAEEHDWSGGPVPQVGDRIRVYANLDDPGNGITHGRDGDWVVSKVQTFSSFDTSDRIVVCSCVHSPISPDWEELRRGAPVPEMLSNVAP
ncbi:MAG: hypothetical protein O3A14_19410 [Cyanobacteria bacterium]|nr:hypothetical protein [Cyanobacteriota bacterium]